MIQVSRVDYKILFVEYEKKDQLFIENLLRKNGFKVVVVDDYEKAASELEKGIYHIVIVNILPLDVKCIQFLNNLYYRSLNVEIISVIDKSMFEESLAILSRNPYYCMVFKPFGDGLFLLNALRKIVKHLNQTFLYEDIKKDLVEKNKIIINKDIEMQQSFYRLKETLESAQSLSFPMDIDMIYKAIVSHLSRGFSCIIFTYDEGVKKLRCLYKAKKFSDYEEVKDVAISFYRILEEDIKGIIENFDKDIRYKEQIKSLFGVNNFRSFSLGTSYGVYGLVVIYDYEQSDFGEETFNCLRLYLMEASLTIENAILRAKISLGTEDDALTKLVSYKAFLSNFEHCLHQAKRHNEFVSLLIIDIDHLKKYNEKYGYIRGDRVIQIVSELIKATIRRSDIVARMGEDKFIVMLGKTDKEGSSIAINKLVETIESYSFPDGHTQPFGKITISMGYAIFPEDGDAPETLIKKARERLEDAKKNKGVKHNI